MYHRSLTILSLLLIFSVLVVGCSKTVKKENVEPTGFISDVSMLEADQEGKVSLLYINEATDFSSYNKVWLETVTIFVYEGSELAKLPPEKIQELADYANEALARELGENNEIVDQAGPNTAQMRFAITEASGSITLVDTVSTVVPPARAFSELKKLITGKHLGVGDAAFEAEALDSITGERIAAAMGARAGGKAVKTNADEFRDVKAAVDAWAVTVSERFESLKQESAQ